jgi:hypothetical protein
MVNLIEQSISLEGTITNAIMEGRIALVFRYCL